jgi:hypothetical protein
MEIRWVILIHLEGGRKGAGDLLDRPGAVIPG